MVSLGCAWFEQQVKLRQPPLQAPSWKWQEEGFRLKDVCADREGGGGPGWLLPAAQAWPRLALLSQLGKGGRQGGGRSLGAKQHYRHLR